ncbi:MAG: hypothetical protein V9G24_16285 [Rhodoblastus sp.]
MRQEGEDAGEIVRKGDGLGRLGVGVAGHQGVQVAARLGHDHRAQRQDAVAHRQHARAQRHARQRVAQVIAAARQLQVAAIVGAYKRNDLPFDAEEEILDAGLVGVLLYARGANGGHGVYDGRGILRGDDAAFGQHDGMRVVCVEHGREKVRLGIGIGRLQDVAAID